MADPLLGVDEIDTPIDDYLSLHAEIFRRFPERSSGRSFGIEWSGWRYFVKYAEGDAALGLERHRVIQNRVNHSAIPRHVNTIRTPDGRADLYEWVDGENLYDHKPRFYALPVAERLRALTFVYDLSQMIADAGFIAVDFYDGSLIYDYDRRLLHVVDLDEYRAGPFTVEGDRLPGSTRFMAPEEFKTGALIDQVTNVFTLGRAALVLLGDGTGHPDAFGWTEPSKAVVDRATNPNRDLRYSSVTEFIDAWRQVVELV